MWLSLPPKHSARTGPVRSTAASQTRRKCSRCSKNNRVQNNHNKRIDGNSRYPPTGYPQQTPIAG